MIYLDAMAKSPLNQDVKRSIKHNLDCNWYNPSSDNYSSKQVRGKIEDVRRIIAKDINCKPDEIVFTSGGSEGNTLAFKLRAIQPHGKILLADATSHHSITSQFDDIKGFMLTVDNEGNINIDYLVKKLNELKNLGRTIIVSICGANNEIGTIQDIKKISKIVHKHYAILHVDAVQLYPYQKIDVKDMGIDIMSVSGSKLGCPSGVGFCYVSSKIELSPIIYGTQEKSLRGGTENGVYIVGMGEAVRNIETHRKENQEDIVEKANEFLNKVLAIDKNFYLVGKPFDDNQRLKCCLNICFSGYDAKSLLMYLDLNDIVASGGSACNTHTLETSHVLRAVGIKGDDLYSCVRFSFTNEELQKDGVIDEVVKVITQFVEHNKRFK